MDYNIIYKKQFLIFDLDGTLTESKSDLSEVMAVLLEQVLKQYKIIIISGCSFEQMKNQFIEVLRISLKDTKEENKIFSNLYLLPTSGSQLFLFENGFYKKIYEYKLTLKDKNLICDAFNNSMEILKICSNNLNGKICEDRKCQITFSLCGQQAPFEIKKTFDPEQKIRIKIIKQMNKILNNKYEISIGGTTSIDVTKKGFNKKFGLEKFISFLKINKNEVVFIGDSLFEGGNDCSIKQLNIDYIEVKNPEETIKFIKSIV